MAIPHPQPFGAVLKRLRLAAGLTQAVLAERAGLSLRVISDLERGVIRTPHQDTLQLLTAALQLAPAERAGFEAAARWHGASGTRLSPGGQPPRPTAPLTGRAHEVAQLQRHLAGEGPPLLLLAGEPGIGKTRLLVEAVPEAVQRGWRVLEGGCHRHSGQEPYAPLVSALAQYFQPQGPAQRRTDLQGCAWLVRLLPELAGAGLTPLPTWTVPPEQERRLLFAAVGRFLQNVAGPAGTLLVLDDLHWAGTDALDLLASLLQAPLEAPLRVIGAYRSTEVRSPDPLGLVVTDLAVRGLVTQQRVGPLSPGEARALLGVLLAEEPVTDRWEQVVARTGGVPFFLVSCAQSLQAEQAEGRPAEGVPWNVAESIRQRVALLPEAVQELLGVAAVVGRVVPGQLLAAITAWPEEAVIASLEAACQARLLIEDGEESYRFAHDLIREVVETDLSAARRKMLHRRVAQALERGPGEPPIEQLAYHYAQSNQQQKALGYLEQAADRAKKQYAHAEAEACYQRLIELAHRQGDRKREGKALEQLGVLLDVMGRMDEAQQLLERSILIYRSAGDIEDLRRGLARLARVYRASGRAHEGLTWVRSFLTVAEAGEPSPGLAMLHRGLASLYAGTGHYRAQLEAAEQAARTARVLRNDALVAEAEQMHSHALAGLGRTEESLQVAEHAIPLAEAQGDLWTLGFLVNQVAHASLRKGRVEESRDLAERALELAERTGAPGPTGLMLCHRGTVEFVLGMWGRARRDYERAASIVRPLGVYWIAALPPFALGELSLTEGKWEIASRSLKESLVLAERSSDIETLRMVQAALAERDLLEGRPEAARVRLEPHLDRLGQQEAGVTALLPLLAWAYLDLGNQTQAQTVATQAMVRAEEEPNRLALVETLRVRALAALQQDRWQEAEDALEQALILTRAMPYPYAEAKALYVYGLLHRQQGEPALARERLEAALAILHRLGERLYAKQVEQAFVLLKHSV